MKESLCGKRKPKAKREKELRLAKCFCEYPYKGMNVVCDLIIKENDLNNDCF